MFAKVCVASSSTSMLQHSHERCAATSPTLHQPARNVCRRSLTNTRKFLDVDMPAGMRHASAAPRACSSHPAALSKLQRLPLAPGTMAGKPWGVKYRAHHACATKTQHSKLVRTCQFTALHPHALLTPVLLHSSCTAAVEADSCRSIACCDKWDPTVDDASSCSPGPKT
jgi:hypothetical protein